MPTEDQMTWCSTHRQPMFMCKHEGKTDCGDKLLEKFFPNEHGFEGGDAREDQLQDNLSIPRQSK